jgi:hypothetical protein
MQSGSQWTKRSIGLLSWASQYNTKSNPIRFLGAETALANREIGVPRGLGFWLYYKAGDLAAAGCYVG